MIYINQSRINKKKAFTLIELLIVIAIIGILFIVLVSKVDFATDKSKASGVQTDFRSFQMALETVSKENAGFNSFGWNTGDTDGDRVRNSYDEGDKACTESGCTECKQDGVIGPHEVWTGHKVYTETWDDTCFYTLVKPGTTFAADGYDKDAIFALETAINKNLDPKLHITIDAKTGLITMANGAQDPWNTQYHGAYISAEDGMDRGAIVMYSNGANQKFGSEHDIANGVPTVIVPGNNKNGADDYSMVVCYTYKNGYGEIGNLTTGFSNNQTFLTGNSSNVLDATPNTPIIPDDQNLPVNGIYEMLDGANQTFDADAPTDLAFRSKADFNKFSEVKVDGVSVASTNYTVREGSTIVTLKADYLKTLDVGEHSIEVVSNDGVAQVAFDVTQREPDIEQYTISGVYVFGDNWTYLPNGEEFEQYINYKVVNYYGFTGLVLDRGRIYIHDGYIGIYADGLGLLATLEAGYMLDFGSTPQVVDKIFYDWLTSNAEKVEKNFVYFYTYSEGEEGICVAESGMTWSEWMESEYNYPGCYNDADMIMSSYYGTLYNINPEDYQGTNWDVEYTNYVSRPNETIQAKTYYFVKE